MTWRDDWCSGQEQIDIEHQRLLRDVNDLVRMAGESVQVEKLSESYDWFVEEVAAHFRYEEEVLQENHYADVERHGRLHRELLDTAGRLREHILRAPERAVDILMLLMDDIVMGHLLTEDVQFFPLFRKSDAQD